MRSSVIFACLALCACAPQSLWLKPGAAADDFSNDKYACMQQSQQQNSSAYVDRYGGVASSGMITNGNLFGACMNARGWYLTAVSDPKAFNDEFKVLAADRLEMCSRPDLQVIFSKKMSCDAKAATPQQLADKSKATEPEKAALRQWQDSVQLNNQKAEEIDRKYARQTGDMMASLIERNTQVVMQLASQLEDGRITWGEFNQSRLDAVHRGEEEAKTLVRS
jgi:hypothetical protein